MYKKIRAHPTTREIYGERLAAEGTIPPNWLDNERDAFRKFLDDEFEAATDFKSNKADWLDGQWAGFAPPVDDDRRGDTAIEIDQLKDVGRTILFVSEKIQGPPNAAAGAGSARQIL